MSNSIKQRMNGISCKRDAQELRSLLETILVDLGVLRTPAGALVTDYTAGRAEIVKLVTDISALRTTVAALQVDCANRLANHNTLIAKLNADAGVTDIDYAVATAATASAPAAITAGNPAAVSAVTPAALTLVA